METWRNFGLVAFSAVMGVVTAVAIARHAPPAPVAPEALSVDAAPASAAPSPVVRAGYEEGGNRLPARQLPFETGE